MLGASQINMKENIMFSSSSANEVFKLFSLYAIVRKGSNIAMVNTTTETHHA